MFATGVTRHVVEYDKLRFLPEIIVMLSVKNVANSVYIYHIFSQLVKNDMLLSVITSYFSLICNDVCEECL